MSRILCIIDGMTDARFQAGHYSALAAMQPLPAIRTVPSGCQPESLTCILTLLGIAPIPPFLRGYAEALGADIPVAREDLILRATWFKVEGETCKLPAPAPERLKGGEKALYYRLGGYQSLLVLPKMAEYVAALRTASFYSQGTKTLASLRPSGNALLERIFDANCKDGLCMVPWGQSRPATLPPFPQPTAVICGTGIVRGIANLLQMTLISVPGATGDIDTNLAAKTEAALKAAEAYPFVLLHINGADEAAHRRNAAEKERFLNAVNRLVLWRLLSSRHTLYVTADHATDPATGLHGGILQPLFRKKTQEKKHYGYSQ